MRRFSSRYKLVLEYVGSQFRGWQRTPGFKTVQGVLEDASGRLCGGVENVSVQSVSRTDAGVHALGNVAFLTLNHRDGQRLGAVDADVVRNALNGHFKSNRLGVRVRQCSPQHGRYPNVLGKEYVYRIMCGYPKHQDPIWESDRAWSIPSSLDIAPMREAGFMFCGEHDFTSFKNSNCGSPSPIKEVMMCSMEYVEARPFTLGHRLETQMMHITVYGKGFLQHQVRHMVGALVAVGRGMASPSDVRDRLARPDVDNRLGHCAPAHGLFLTRIDFQESGDGHSPECPVEHHK